MRRVPTAITLVCALTLSSAATTVGAKPTPAKPAKGKVSRGKVGKGKVGKHPVAKPVGIPKITKVMPLSSCSPGGSVILQGEHLGTQPGTLRLVGFFPDRYLELTQVEWKDGAIGGQVPMVTGVVDQKVRLQVVRADGLPSNTIECAFTATRVTRTTSSGSLRKHMCRFGDGAGMGCLADDEIDGAIRTSAGCFHRNNSCGGNITGIDEFSSKPFFNGWTIKEIRVYQPQLEDTSVLGVSNAWGKTTRKKFSWQGLEGGMSTYAVHTSQVISMSVRFNNESDEFFQYEVGFLVEGPEGVPYHEKVVIPEAPQQTLDDWNPIPDAGASALSIVSPKSGKWVSTSSTGVTLDLSGPAAWKSSTIELEWIKYGAGKDPSIEKYGVVPAAPRKLPGSAFPKEVPAEVLGGTGEYAVRVRQKGHNWTDYRNFTIGKPYIMQEGKAGKAQKTGHKKLGKGKLSPSR